MELIRAETKIDYREDERHVFAWGVFHDLAASGMYAPPSGERKNSEEGRRVATERVINNLYYNVIVNLAGQFAVPTLSLSIPPGA